MMELVVDLAARSAVPLATVNTRSTGYWVLDLTVLTVFGAWLFRRAHKNRIQQRRLQDAPKPGPGAAPGWYPDSYDATLLRYFDGRNWTTATKPFE